MCKKILTFYYNIADEFSQLFKKIFHTCDLNDGQQNYCLIIAYKVYLQM